MFCRYLPSSGITYKGKLFKLLRQWSIYIYLSYKRRYEMRKSSRLSQNVTNKLRIKYSSAWSFVVTRYIKLVKYSCEGVFIFGLSHTLLHHTIDPFIHDSRLLYAYRCHLHDYDSIAVVVTKYCGCEQNQMSLAKIYRISSVK